MTIGKQHYDIADLIITQTENRQIAWTATASNETFSTVFGSTLMMIKKELSFQEVHDDDGYLNLYTITIFNNKNVLLDTFNDEDLFAQVATYRPTVESGHYYQKFEAIFSMIRRQALQVDETLDSLIKNLKIGNYIPF